MNKSFNAVFNSIKNNEILTWKFEDALLWYKDFKIIWKITKWEKHSSNQIYFIDSTFNKKTLDFFNKTNNINISIFQKQSTVQNFINWKNDIENKFKNIKLENFWFIKDENFENLIEELNPEEYNTTINFKNMTKDFSVKSFTQLTDILFIWIIKNYLYYPNLREDIEQQFKIAAMTLSWTEYSKFKNLFIFNLWKLIDFSMSQYDLNIYGLKKNLLKEEPHPISNIFLDLMLDKTNVRNVKRENQKIYWKKVVFPMLNLQLFIWKTNKDKNFKQRINSNIFHSKEHDKSNPHKFISLDLLLIMKYQIIRDYLNSFMIRNKKLIKDDMLIFIIQIIYFINKMLWLLWEFPMWNFKFEFWKIPLLSYYWKGYNATNHPLDDLSETRYTKEFDYILEQEISQKIIVEFNKIEWKLFEDKDFLALETRFWFRTF